MFSLWSGDAPAPASAPVPSASVPSAEPLPIEQLRGVLAQLEIVARELLLQVHDLHDAINQIEQGE